MYAPILCSLIVPASPSISGQEGDAACYVNGSLDSITDSFSRSWALFANPAMSGALENASFVLNGSLYSVIIIPFIIAFGVTA